MPGPLCTSRVSFGKAPSWWWKCRYDAPGPLPSEVTSWRSFQQDRSPARACVYGCRLCKREGNLWAESAAKDEGGEFRGAVLPFLVHAPLVHPSHPPLDFSLPLFLSLFQWKLGLKQSMWRQVYRDRLLTRTPILSSKRSCLTLALWLSRAVANV